ncbi:polar amino acid transport system ATP-binding protein [Lachnospiraceae bacterium XBB2008]|nr:polar amino acid transport system ATP-binding protein [Lachnospiraceae bacterium XBB2008]
MSEEILKIEHLYKRYDDIPVLEDISLTVKKGETVVIVGPSGCGKSTFLRCINGLEDIQDGHVYLEDALINPASGESVQNRQRIGMVFQSYDLFPHKTVLENVILAPMKVQKRKKEDATEEALALLDRVGLSARKDSYPRQLSGGQKQRVAIVRALMMHPEVLLFDEVTAALDPEMVREVLDVILDLARNNSTMLIVTHEMAFARAIADRVLFLDGGHIIEDTDPGQFFDSPGTDRAKKFLQTFEYESVR